MKPSDFQSHHFAAGMYAKEMRVPKGISLVSHVHKVDHFSILAVGRAAVEVDGVRKEYDAGSVVTIEAGKRHKVVALEDMVWFCIWPTDETDVEKIDEVLIGSDDAV